MEKLVFTCNFDLEGAIISLHHKNSFPAAKFLFSSSQLTRWKYSKMARVVQVQFDVQLFGSL